MSRVTAEVRALLQARQDQRKAELDAHRRDVQFSVGDEVLLDTEHTPLPSRSLLSPRWMGPFKVLARPAPNTYRLAIPATWRACDEFNVERLTVAPTASTALRARLRLSRAPAGPNMRCRRCSSSRCAGAGPTCWCAGRAVTPRATRGSRWTTSPTARRPSPLSSGPRAALCHGPPRRRRPSPPRRICPRQALPSMLRRRAIVVRSLWGGRCSTGGRAGRGMAARYGRSPLCARRFLARGCLHAPDVGAALYR